MKMKTFTVIGYDEANGAIRSLFVTAKDEQHSFWIAAQENPHLEFVVSIHGRATESNLLAFPGESVVSSATILEQGDVFNYCEEVTHE